MRLRMNNFSIMGVHCKILLLGGGHEKPIHWKGLPKKGVLDSLQFADIRGGSQTEILVQIGNICLIKIEIVQENIPLSLSKTPFKKAEAVLNIRNNKIQMVIEDGDITISANGHYIIRSVFFQIEHAILMTLRY